MNKDSPFSVILASILGAAVGSLVGLQIHPYFWWIGLIVGGLIGYLSYEWKVVLAAIPRAVAVVTGTRTREATRLFLLTWGFTASLIFHALIFAIVISGDEPNWEMYTSRGMMLFYLGITLLMAIFFTRMSMKDYDRSLLHPLTDAKKLLWRTFPPLLYAWHIPRLLLKALFWTLPYLGRFLRELFIRINSERRLICGMSAMLGSSVGYFLANPLAGAIAGGAFGLLFFEVVSKRLLRLTAR